MLFCVIFGPGNGLSKLANVSSKSANISSISSYRSLKSKSGASISLSGKRSMFWNDERVSMLKDDNVELWNGEEDLSKFGPRLWFDGFKA